MLYPTSCCSRSMEFCSFTFKTPSLLSKATFARLLWRTEDKVSNRYFIPEAISNVTIAFPGSIFSATGKFTTSDSRFNNKNAEISTITTTDAATHGKNKRFLPRCCFFNRTKAFSTSKFSTTHNSHPTCSLSLNSLTNSFNPSTLDNISSTPSSSTSESSPRLYRNNSFANSNGFFIFLVKFLLLQITCKKGLRKKCFFIPIFIFGYPRTPILSHLR